MDALYIILGAALFGVVTAITLLTWLVRDVRHLHRRLDAHAMAVVILSAQHPNIEIPAEPAPPKLTLIKGELSALMAIATTAAAVASWRPKRLALAATATAMAAGAVALLTFGAPAHLHEGAGAPQQRISAVLPSSGRGRRRLPPPLIPTPRAPLPTPTAPPVYAPTTPPANAVPAAAPRTTGAQPTPPAPPAPSSTPHAPRTSPTPSLSPPTSPPTATPSTSSTTPCGLIVIEAAPLLTLCVL